MKKKPNKRLTMILKVTQEEIWVNKEVSLIPEEKRHIFLILLEHVLLISQIQEATSREILQKGLQI